MLAVNCPSMWTMQVSEGAYFGGSAADTLKEQKAQYTSGLRVYDISRPEAPREISFMPTDGVGPHRIWYVGGRYAYVSIHFSDFSDHILAVVDMSDPTKPNMWPANGGFPACGPAAAKRRPGRKANDLPCIMHWLPAISPTRRGATAVSQFSTLPIRRTPKLVSYRQYDPPFGGGTHSPLPLPDRNLAVVADEPNAANCKLGIRYGWIFDVRVPENPVSIATLPVPAEADYCAKGGNFGIHNLWENRPGAFQSSRYIFATYYNAGVRVFDIENAFQPREVAYYVPPDPARMFDPRPDRPQVVQSADCFVDRNGLMYLTNSERRLEYFAV